MSTNKAAESKRRKFCHNCGAEINDTDTSGGFCTQCKSPLEPEPLPLRHQLLLSLQEIQSQREAER